jgi:hypothetical protein
MSETATSSPAPNEDMSLVCVFGRRELLSQVLTFVGEGTEIASMLVCKDLCMCVRLLRGWQEEKKEEEKNHTEQKIVCGVSVSRVSCFLPHMSLAEWGADVLGMPITERTTKLAVEGGHVSTLNWLLNSGVPLERNCWSEYDGTTVNMTHHGACYWAVEAGYLSMLQYLRSLEPPFAWGKDLCSLAAKNGHLHVLQWARSQAEPCPWGEETCAGAALNGHLNVLQWARSQAEPCPWDEGTCMFAAEKGHLHVLQWARSQPEPCPWDERTCANAAMNGHLHVVQWARSQPEPCPWDEMTCTMAAYNGHLEVLQWARSQAEPCPWDESTAEKASQWGIS